MVVVGFPFAAHSNRSDAVRDYAALLTRIDELFIGDYEERDVATAAMRSAVAALNDEWSFYMTQEEFLWHMDSSSNRYDGIGFTVATDEETGNMLVVSVFSGSAAEAAGIVPGDIITAVDSKPITGFTHADLREALVRPIGDSAELTVLRADGSIEVLTAVYSVVFVSPTSSEMLEGDIGYVRLTNFHYRSAHSFITATDELIEQGALGLIFDVRDNPGGWVSEMTAILDYLLPEGEIFISVDRSGKEAITTSDEFYIDLPMVVLVDRFSFSGAEYFAAMLREYGFAEVVGEQTTGKSRMQTSVRLPGGGALNISFAEYLTKNRVSLHDAGGLTPDHEVELTREEQMLFFEGNLEKGDDPQLQKAISLLDSLFSY